MKPSTNHRHFHVGLSKDFLDERGSLVFPDIGLSLLENVPGLSHEFMAEYRAEYVPEQLRDFDVIISLKPRVSADSLKGVERLCAIGRCGVGYDNVDWRPVRKTTLPFSSRRPRSCAPWLSLSYFLCWHSPTIWC